MQVFRILEDNMPAGEFITRSLPPGIWTWWFRDRKTKNPLSISARVELLKESHLAFLIPLELASNKQSEFYIERTR